MIRRAVEKNETESENNVPGDVLMQKVILSKDLREVRD